MLSELSDSALNHIAKEQYERALTLLQKAQGIINVISLDRCRRDKLLAFIVFHNHACCYQKYRSYNFISS